MNFVELLCFAVFITSNLDRALSCDARVGTSCYTFSSNPRDWYHAQLDCDGRGGHLAAVVTRPEQEALQREMETRNWETAWLGGKEEQTDFRWIKDETFLRLQGCYHDDPFDRDLPESISHLSSSKITPQSCIEACAEIGKAYAGILADLRGRGRNEFSCRCGDTYGRHGQTTGCTVRCRADQEQYCGGLNKQAIFRVDGTQLSLWYMDQPNNFSPYQECVALRHDHTFKWGDEFCWKKFYHICQFDMGPVECQRKNYTSVSGACFELVYVKKSWFKSRYDCERRDGTLLQMVEPVVLETIRAKAAKSWHNWWIGATNRRWTWISTGDELRYVSWAETSPNSPLEQCILMKHTRGISLWDDDRCSERHNYICQTFYSEAFILDNSQPTSTKTTPSTTSLSSSRPTASPTLSSSSSTSSAPTKPSSSSTRSTRFTSSSTVTPPTTPPTPAPTFNRPEPEATCITGEYECREIYQCIFSNWLCDGDVDCVDGTDEIGCDERPTGPGMTCKPGWFLCQVSTRCIPGGYECDGENDCVDGSDEIDCPGKPRASRCAGNEFDCGVGYPGCVPESWKCDNDFDCENQSDERNCPNSTIRGTVRSTKSTASIQTSTSTPSTTRSTTRASSTSTRPTTTSTVSPTTTSTARSSNSPTSKPKPSPTQQDTPTTSLPTTRKTATTAGSTRKQTTTRLPPTPPPCNKTYCQMFCMNGFQTDHNGCKICQCRAEISGSNDNENTPADTEKSRVKCPAKIQCRNLCLNGLKVDVNGCPTCQCIPNDEASKCSSRRCPTYCPDGYLYTKENCSTCQCKNVQTFDIDPHVRSVTPGVRTDRPANTVAFKCSTFRCNLHCQFGYVMKEDGCPTCKCSEGTTTLPQTVPTVSCPSLSCSLQCQSGYQRDLHGCPICLCKDDACSGINCRYGTFCDKRLQCRSGSCSYTVRCLQPRCNAVCDVLCPNGYVTSERNCPSCHCRDKPCYGRHCGVCWTRHQCRRQGRCLYKVTCFEHILPPTFGLNSTAIPHTRQKRK